MRLHAMAVALAAALVTSACQQAPQGGAAAEAAAVAVAPAAPSPVAPAVDLSRRTIADLEEAADRALREGRIYTPAGDSAAEYWLEARARDHDRIAVVNAVAGLQPYLLIGCEEAIARRDFAEARRLHGLIAAADLRTRARAPAPAAPAGAALSAAGPRSPHGGCGGSRLHHPPRWPGGEHARAQGQPPGVFDRSALAAVGDYRFEPTGRNVPSTVTVRFTLDR